MGEVHVGELENSAHGSWGLGRRGFALVLILGILLAYPETGNSAPRCQINGASKLQGPVDGSIDMIGGSLDLTRGCDPEPPVPPPSPSAIQGPGTDNNGTYTLTWGTAWRANSYQLQRKLNSGSWSTIQNTSSTSRNESSLADGTYSYRVRACNAGGCSSYTSTKTVVVTSAPPTPSTIQGPGTDNDGTFALSWGNAAGATSYELQRNLNGGSWSTVQSTSATSRNESSLADGTYNYRVRACNAGGCSSYTSTKTVVVTSPPPPPPPDSPAPPNDPGPSASSDQLGATEGTFRVDESGSATYALPLSIASGTAGVAPSVSLNYSSSARNGIAGMGWSVSGLSAISRCRQTLEQDRNALPISWTATDRFCLNGKRLILDTGSYGAAGSTYRTEVDSGVVVTAVGQESGEPDYFKVVGEDGSTSHYGRTDNNAAGNAELKAGQRTYTWGIRKFEDSVGNAIWFDYESGSSSLLIQDILYAYGSNDGPAGENARVNFVYETRSDVISSFVGGYEF